jgi:hypothetical protein
MSTTASTDTLKRPKVLDDACFTFYFTVCALKTVSTHAREASNGTNAGASILAGVAVTEVDNYRLTQRLQKII